MSDNIFNLGSQTDLEKILEMDVINIREYSLLIKFLDNETRRKTLFKNHPSELISIIGKINSSYESFFNIQFMNEIVKEEKDYYDSVVSSTETKFIKDQKFAFHDLLDFSRNGENIYYLLGYAGTGKTTTIVTFLSFLLENGYTHKIAFTAPTNQAVDVLKNKWTNFCGKIMTNNTSTNFLTIHKLLNYGLSFDKNGNKKLRRHGKSTIFQYEFVIVDECSMISKRIFNAITKNIKNSDIKVIFVGDPAQLPPVNSPTIINISNNENMCILKNIVRTDDDMIAKFSQEVRTWATDNTNTHILQIKPYISKKVSVYSVKNRDKLETRWFSILTKHHKKKIPAIILTWTNKQTDIYNETVKKIIFGETSNKFMIGELLVFKSAYNFRGVNFRTSAQVVINKISSKKIDVKELNHEKIVGKNDISEELEMQVENYVNKINSKIFGTQFVWILSVSETNKFFPKTGNIQIVDDIETFNKNRNICEEYVEKLKDKIKDIPEIILNNFWEEIETKLCSPYANIRNGYSITTHSSQGTDYFDVFVDLHDMKKNKNIGEAKRCIYTAITRTINKVHILI